MRTLALGLAAALMIGASGAYAADAKSTGDTAKTTTAAPAKSAKAEPSEKSKKCSAEADAKNLHGQPRKEFRKTCLKAA